MLRCVCNSSVATNAPIRSNTLGVLDGGVMEQLAVASKAIALDNGKVLLFDLNDLRVVAERERFRVMPSIRRLRHPLCNSTCGHVTIVACRDGVMASTLP